MSSPPVYAVLKYKLSINAQLYEHYQIVKISNNYVELFRYTINKQSCLKLEMILIIATFELQVCGNMAGQSAVIRSKTLCQ